MYYYGDEKLNITHSMLPGKKEVLFIAHIQLQLKTVIFLESEEELNIYSGSSVTAINCAIFQATLPINMEELFIISTTQLQFHMLHSLLTELALYKDELPIVDLS